MSLRFYEISHAHLRILNPFTLEKLMLVADICNLRPGLGHLDLACGKGEMLCQWSSRFGIHGVGVDSGGVFLADAQRRSVDMEVDDRVRFEVAEAAEYLKRNKEVFDVVSCIGATWIGGGLT